MCAKKIQIGPFGRLHGLALPAYYGLVPGEKGTPRR